VGKDDVRHLLEGVHVLLADDDRSFGEMVAIALDFAGARVTRVASAKEALARLADGDVDVLVSDLSMPQEDGLWLINEVRRGASAPSVPAVLVTGYGSDHYRTRAGTEGYNLYVEKPFDVWEFCEKVYKLLRQSSRR